MAYDFFLRDLLLVLNNIYVKFEHNLKWFDPEWPNVNLLKSTHTYKPTLLTAEPLNQISFHNLYVWSQTSIFSKISYCSFHTVKICCAFSWKVVVNLPLLKLMNAFIELVSQLAVNTLPLFNLKLCTCYTAKCQAIKHAAFFKCFKLYHEKYDHVHIMHYSLTKGKAHNVFYEISCKIEV